MLAVSLLSPQGVRRLASSSVSPGWPVSSPSTSAGVELNGARRWLSIGGHSMQPSEFAKPAFVVVSAWLLRRGTPSPGHAGADPRVAIFVVFAALLVIQPDVGQTLLISLRVGSPCFSSPASRCAARA